MALELSDYGHRYGYIPNKPDHRDFGMARLTQLAVPLPRKASNAACMGPVLDQGQQGSCTAHTGAADREFLHWKQFAASGRPVAPTAMGLYSPAYLYYMERVIDESIGKGDCGSSGRSSCQALRLYGCALRADMPYFDSDYMTAPSDKQKEAASEWPTGGYHFAANVDDMKSIIASGYNCRMGFAVLDSFEKMGSDGIWIPDGGLLGYHETLIYEYDDDLAGGTFLVRNSWGKDWGKKGDFYLRYQDAADRNILIDACIQHLGIWA